MSWRWLLNVITKQVGFYFFFTTYFARFTSKLHNYWTKMIKKQIVNIKVNFIFLTFIEVWTQWVPCKVNMMPFGHHLLCMGPIAFIQLCMGPIAFILQWMSEKWNLFLKYLVFLLVLRVGFDLWMWLFMYIIIKTQTSRFLENIKW